MWAAADWRLRRTTARASDRISPKRAYQRSFWKSSWLLGVASRPPPPACGRNRVDCIAVDVQGLRSSMPRRGLPVPSGVHSQVGRVNQPRGTSLGSIARQSDQIPDNPAAAKCSVKPFKGNADYLYTAVEIVAVRARPLTQPPSSAATSSVAADLETASTPAAHRYRKQPCEPACLLHIKEAG